LIFVHLLIVIENEFIKNSKQLEIKKLNLQEILNVNDEFKAFDKYLIDLKRETPIYIEKEISDLRKLPPKRLASKLSNVTLKGTNNAFYDYEIYLTYPRYLNFDFSYFGGHRVHFKYNYDKFRNVLSELRIGDFLDCQFQFQNVQFYGQGDSWFDLVEIAKIEIEI
jgi:hypothetical protein